MDTKYCYACKQDHPITEFYPKTPRCKACHKEASKVWFERNKDELAIRARKRSEEARLNRVAYRQERRIEARIWVYEYLKRNPCNKCGQVNPVVLDFHHRDPATKSFEIGRWIGKQYVSRFMEKDLLYGIDIDPPQGHPIHVFLDEVAKCDILCRNCHALETGKQKNTFRYRMWLLEGSGTGS